MNTKLALLSAALLAISPIAVAQDTGNTGDVGDTSDADSTISGSGDAAQEDQHGDTLADDGATEPGLDEISPAAGTDYFDQWDADDDASLSMSEFNQGVDALGTYDAWDTDGDGMLTEDEYNTGMYNSFDRDGDSAIDEDEFSAYSQPESDLPY